MPWNETTRKQYSRKTERYESDLTDAERALLEPLLPSSRRLGRPRQVDLRDVVNAIAYMLWTGCSWRALPKDCPAFTTVQIYFYAWSRSGVLEQVCVRFTTLERLRSGRSADPSAAIIDSQSVPTVEAGSEECGYNTGKTIKGCKRHLAVDVDGNTPAAQVHSAHIQDRDGARPLLLALQAGQNTVQTVFADGACGGNKLASALKKANCPITVEVIGKPKDTKGVVVMSRRWVVERSFGRLRRCRCLSRDFERSIASALAWLLLALSRVLMRRLGRMQVTVTT